MVVDHRACPTPMLIIRPPDPDPSVDGPGRQQGLRLAKARTSESSRASSILGADDDSAGCRPSHKRRERLGRRPLGHGSSSELCLLSGEDRRGQHRAGRLPVRRRSDGQSAGERETTERRETESSARSSSKARTAPRRPARRGPSRWSVAISRTSPAGTTGHARDARLMRHEPKFVTDHW